MGTKQHSWLGILGVVILFSVLLLLGIWAFNGFFSPDRMARIESYFKIFLLLWVVGVFGLLRLYNSQVSNTRFIIKLREVIVKVLSDIPGLERVIKESTRTLQQTSTKVENLDKTIERLNSISNKDNMSDRGK